MRKRRIPSLYLSVLLLLFVFSEPTANAQLQTNTQALQKTSQQLAAQYQSFHKVLLQTAKERHWPLTLRGKNGRMAYLRGVNGLGLPYYVTTTDNIISAATIRTNTLWSGGSTGLNLSGSSAFLKGRIAVWDEGLVRPTHVELKGRVIQEDAAQGDTVLSDHSTHVSGTMIAAGVNPVAKGMSYGAQQLQAYDFNNDESEMAKAAGGTNGIIVSNHSYADIAGWYIDEAENSRWEFWGNPGDTVDTKFGLYDADTRIWDSIAYIAPYYLIAKAGGNNPGETGPDVGQPYFRFNTAGDMASAGNRPAGISSNAGYKTIATYGNAKNILTLGAVNPIPGGYNQPSDVVQASFSSLGPTGDGRIKPDVVADGVNVLSSISTADNAYDIYSGTSMATPATAGSSFLLQEYYGKLHHDSLMLSATLKGLLIHTADEAGNNPGPDYTFGWGLVDMQKAAAVITGDNTDQSQQIKQSSLIQGTKDSETFTVTASGKMPVSATICWTDPPAVVDSAHLNTHNFGDTVRKLVNDLDLRIKDNTTNKVYMPWILNPFNPGNAATKGDNIRDNVEKVELGDSLIPGRTYSITVSHKGTLKNATQAYSLLISGAGTTYCPSASTTTTGTAMSNVAVNGNSIYSGTACPNAEYIDSTGGNLVQLSVGQTYPISMSYQNCSGSLTTNVAIYIDANSNDTFENNELVYTQNNLTSLTTSSTTPAGGFTVPVTAKAGSYARMRIIFEDGAIPSPCGTYPSGETMDFRVAFTSPANDVGVTTLEYPTSTICANDSQLVSVHIHNFGSVAQTGGVPVKTKITGGSASVTLTATCLDSIPPGGDVIFTYNTTFPSVAGNTYTFLSWTALSTDPNTSNDTSTASITVNAAGAAGTGAATLCGANAASVLLHADVTGDDLALWYDSPTATTPIAAGNNTSTTEIPADKTYYLGLNDLQSKAGPPNKTASILTAAAGSSVIGAYFRFSGNFIKFSTHVPLTIESAKMYIDHAGQIDFTLAQLVSFNDNTGQYEYLPILSNSVDVYPTNPNAKPSDTTNGQLNVTAAGGNSDTGAYFLLNIPVPNPGDYILMFTCENNAMAFLNANIGTNPYPLTLPGVMSITGNDFVDLGKADSITYSQKFYYPLYDIGLRLEGCPSTARTAITATTTGLAPTITAEDTTYVSSATTGNQWYLNDSLLPGSTDQQIIPKIAGLYYTIVYDPTTGCGLKSNSLLYTPNTTDPNDRISLKVGPNPGPGHFNVKFFMDNTADLSIALFDMLGTKVYQKDYGSFGGSFSDVISTTLEAGIYTMKIYHGSDTYIFKIVVRH